MYCKDFLFGFLFIHPHCRAEQGKKLKKKKKACKPLRNPSKVVTHVSSQQQNNLTPDPPQGKVLGELGAEVRYEHPPACPELCIYSMHLQQQGNALGGSSAAASQPPRAAIGFSFRSWN